MEDQSYLLKPSAEFASTTLARISPSYSFHALKHTKQVVRAAGIIGRASRLSTQQLHTVLIAAWFHDVGYVNGAERHEERSCSIAVKILTTWGANTKMIADVSRAILATQLPQKPKDVIGKVLCDADLSYLASAQYELHVSNLGKELEATRGIRLDDQRIWSQRNIEFLKTHRYFTDYGNDILDRRKKVNLNRMIRQLHVTPAINETGSNYSRKPYFVMAKIT